MEKLYLVTIRNRFDLNELSREIKQISVVPGESVFYYAQNLFLPENELLISYNGRTLNTEEYKTIIPNPGDFIVIMPKITGGGDSGKSLLASIAAIGLAMVSFGVGNLASGLSWGGAYASGTVVGMSGWTFWGYAAAAGVQLLGGLLLSSIAPQPKLDLNNDNDSRTYGWGKIQTGIGQGTAIPITYGTVKTAGHLLSSHVSVRNDKQYLNLLLCGGEGPIDSISDIEINDQSISNYSDITWDIRAGTNDQTVIPNFNDTYIDESLMVELENSADWTTRTINGNGYEGLEVTIELPGGLFYSNDDGGLENTSVSIAVEYKKTSDSTWTPILIPASLQENVYQYVGYTVTIKNKDVRSFFPIGTVVTLLTYNGNQSATVQNVSYNYYDGGVDYESYYYTSIVLNVTTDGAYAIRKDYFTDTIITTASSSAIKRTIGIYSGLDADEYEVRAKCSSKSGTTSRYSNRVYLTQISGILKQDFNRPNKVLLGLSILATNQLSGGMPNITWKQTRSKVWVWNTNTSAYEEKDATNPAWACYDLIHRCKRLMNINTSSYEYKVYGAPVARMDYTAFKNWADFCDEIVDGASEKRCTVNFLIDTIGILWETLKPIESMGRGKVIVKGTKYSCIFDGVSDPVQLFNVANIGIDSFSEQFVDTKDRANAVEVTFYNKDNNYERDTITVYSDDYNTATTIPNTTQITLLGCDNYNQAFREAKYRLKLNKYINRTCSWSADIDALACQIGDVVLLQHSVPRWGTGGRLVEATTNTITLDKPVTMEEGESYQIMVRLSDDTLVTKDVTTVAGEQTVLTVSSNFSSLPQKYDLWSFGKTDVYAKPFRIINISKDGDLRCKITGIEYIADVYTEATTIPEIDFTTGTALYDVSAVYAKEETFRQKDGTMISRLNVTWTNPRNKKADEYHVFYSIDNGTTWTYYNRTPLEQIYIENVKTNETYKVKICVSVPPILSNGTISTGVIITGKDVPPSDVPGFNIIQSGSILKVSIVAPSDPDIRNYELRYGPTWANSAFLKSFVDVQTTLDAVQEGTQTFWVKAVDNSNNYSENAKKAIITIFGLPTKNVIVESDPDPLTWTEIGMFYCSRSGCWMIDSVETLGDFTTFDEFFDTDLTLRSDAELTLPNIDLGPNVIEENYFYYDAYGVAKLKTTKTMNDFTYFFDIFGYAHQYVVPQYKIETFMNIDLDYVKNENNYINIWYRTSVDGTNWSTWTPLVNHQFFGRYLQLKFYPGSLDGETNVALCGANIKIDVPDLEENIENVDIPAAKTSITFSQRFFDTPKSIALFTADNTGKQATWRMTNTSKTGFDLELLDSGGSLIAGKLILAKVRGY